MAQDLSRPVNNDVYEQLAERWYAADDDPIALLRAEARLRNPWISDCIRDRYGRQASVLDVGCGGGFLSNALARNGFNIVGLDSSASSLAVAHRHDCTGTVEYVLGDALALPYPDATFDAVSAMDLLEHVENPAKVIAEAARVLRPHGTFFFHTFNRNFFCWLVVIKGVQWFVKNTPRDLHVLRFFITPQEIATYCSASGLALLTVRGCMPAVRSGAFWRMLVTRTVPPNFRFEFCTSTRFGYVGCAEKL